MHATKKIGRPSDYTPELAEEICQAIASDSKGLRRLCEENEHWPARANIYKWFKKHPEFRDNYMQSKESQIEALVDEVLEIADDTSNDTIIKVDEQGNKRAVCNSEWINRSRLRIDTRKWLAAKLCPRIYGDKAAEIQPENDLISIYREKGLLE